jgi:hypothetical protein
VRGDLGDRRAERIAREHPDEHAQVLDAREELLDADRGDDQRRQVHGEVGVALVGADDDGAGLGDGEVGADHPCAGLQEIRPGGPPLALGEVMDVGVLRVGAQRAAEHLGDVAAQLVHGGHDDVARRLVVELLDALAEIGLDHLDAAGPEELAHLAFVGQHRLRLDQRGRAPRAEQVEHRLVVLDGVARPVHVHAVGARVALELFEVVGQMGERVLLDSRGERAQLLPFGKALALPVALLAQVPQPPVVELDVVLRLDELRRGLGVVDALHSRAPLSTWATWMNLSGRFRRSAQPFWCITQDMSGETMYSAPAPWWSLTLS